MNNSGIILVDKPIGISSFNVVYQVRKLTGIKKVGHTGTLDPFASGLLPICVGRATRLASFILASEKEYIAEMQLGIKTDSADITGEIIQSSEITTISENKIHDLKDYVLNIKEQIPPKYSAIKVDGKRAYKLARENADFDMKPRQIDILDFEIISVNLPNIIYRARVSKGTYIRTLSETIAEFLGTVGTTSKLNRIGSGNMQISDSVKLEDLNNNNWKEHLADLGKIFAGYPEIILSDQNILNFCNGRRFFVEYEDCDKVLILNKDRKVFGFAQLIGGKVQPRIVLG